MYIFKTHEFTHELNETHRIHCIVNIWCSFLALALLFLLSSLFLCYFWDTFSRLILPKPCFFISCSSCGARLYYLKIYPKRHNRVVAHYFTVHIRHRNNKIKENQKKSFSFYQEVRLVSCEYLEFYKCVLMKCTVIKVALTVT